MKALHIEFEDAEYEQLKRIRRDKGEGKQETWREALLRLAAAAERRGR